MMDVAGHRVLWVGADSTRCALCPVRYTLANMLRRYAWTTCNPDAGAHPTSRLPKPPEDLIDENLVPMHAGRVHVYAKTAKGRQIRCTTCEACWQWELDMASVHMRGIKGRRAKEENGARLGTSFDSKWPYASFASLHEHYKVSQMPIYSQE